ncbi:MAG: hypothetical protein ACT4OX_07650 [Actinomycetota bacterium]
MVGAVLILVALFVAGPIALFVGGAIWSAVISIMFGQKPGS